MLNFVDLTVILLMLRMPMDMEMLLMVSSFAYKPDQLLGLYN